MRPEDGCLWVYGVGEDGVPAFTRDGMEYYSRSSPTKELPTAHHRRSTRPNDPACVFHRMLTFLCINYRHKVTHEIRLCTGIARREKRER
jgi:hypothetical protein